LSGAACLPSLGSGDVAHIALVPERCEPANEFG
jgi:hypothetical protein